MGAAAALPRCSPRSESILKHGLRVTAGEETRKGLSQQRGHRAGLEVTEEPAGPTRGEQSSKAGS